MSQGFKWKFDRMQENDPGNPQPGESPLAGETYPGHGSIRHICFVWPEGRLFFLNYSYLVSGEYVPEQSAIVLAFTSHRVTLAGRNLAQLFHDLMMQFAKYVVCIDERYVALAEEQKPVVIKIDIHSNE